MRARLCANVLSDRLIACGTGSAVERGRQSACLHLLLPQLDEPGAADHGGLAGAHPAEADVRDIVADLGLGSVSYRLDVSLGSDAVRDVRPPPKVK